MTKTSLSGPLAGCIMLSACAAEPLTRNDLLTQSFARNVALTCVQNGWVTYLPETTAYISTRERIIVNGASREQIEAAHNVASASLASSKLTIQDCRAVEMQAVKEQQASMEALRQREAFAKSMNNLSDTAKQIQATTPRTTHCQANQWGGMVICNTF